MMLIGDGTFVLPGSCCAGFDSPLTRRPTFAPKLGDAPFPATRR